MYQTLIKHFALMGIQSDQITKKYLLNSKNVFVLIMLVICSISANVFLWYEADNFKEYTESFYGTSCVTVSFANFTVNVWKMPNMFRLIENLENCIAKSV